MRPLNWAPLAQAEGLSRRARQLTQDEAEQNKPRARNRGEAEAHHDSKEQVAATTRVATPQKQLGGRRERTPLNADHSAAEAKIRRFSVGHKTRGGALSSLQPIFALQSGERGGDIGAGGWGDHALAFWFTITLSS